MWHLLSLETNDQKNKTEVLWELTSSERQRWCPPLRTLAAFDFLLTVLIWLFPAHGTFLGHIRLEPHKPQQIPIDSTVSFGASTRAYTLREKPQTLPSAVKGDEKMGGEDDELKGLLGLPEEETELDVIPVIFVLGTLVFAVCSRSSCSKWQSVVAGGSSVWWWALDNAYGQLWPGFPAHVGGPCASSLAVRGRD